MFFIVLKETQQHNRQLLLWVKFNRQLLLLELQLSPYAPYTAEEIQVINFFI